MIAFAAGLGSGLAVALLTKLTEMSRLEIGPYAFYGNGALIVLATGAALAIYGLWTWQLAAGRPGRELALSAAGLHLGIGAGGLPSVGALLATGLLFVVPQAVVAWLVYRAAVRRGAGPLALVLIALAGVVVTSPLLTVLFPLQSAGIGLIVAPFLVAATRAGTLARRVALGAGLMAVLLVAGLVVPLLFIR